MSNLGKGTTGNPFADLVSEDQLKQVWKMLGTIVEQSFSTDQVQMQRITASETKRRIDITVELFKTLRAEGWSLVRIRDNLPHYLRCELEGIHYTIPKRNSFTTTDGVLR